jgi:hypothetical protein
LIDSVFHDVFILAETSWLSSAGHVAFSKNYDKVDLFNVPTIPARSVDTEVSQVLYYLLLQKASLMMPTQSRRVPSTHDLDPTCPK